MEKGLILVHDGDYAAVALAELKAGETYEVAGQTVTLTDDIPFGHKAALREIKAGENVIKYGNPLGHATQDIHVGQHIHTHNMGCSQLGDDQTNTMKLIAGLIHNPNAGGVLVLSLGYENNSLSSFQSAIAKASLPFVCICDISVNRL